MGRKCWLQTGKILSALSTLVKRGISQPESGTGHDNSRLPVLTLSDAQKEFCYDISKLIQYMWHYEGGIYTCTFGDAFRDPRVHGVYGEKQSYSAAASAHKQRLACDLNLFMDGVFQTTTLSHKPFGEHWKSLHPDNVWGGDFSDNPDGNHYERLR